MDDFIDEVRDEIEVFRSDRKKDFAAQWVYDPVRPRIPVLDTFDEDFTAMPAEDLVWQGRWFRIERWETREWTIGFGHWDGAFEVYLAKWIIRLEASPPEYR